MPSPTDGPRWWQRLPEDFHRQADGTELDAGHALKVGATAAIDIALRSALSAVLGAAAAPAVLPVARLRQQQMALYQQYADAADSEAVFRHEPCRVRELRRPVLGYRPQGVDSRLLSFRSSQGPLLPGATDHRRSRNNQTAVAQHWCHPDGPRPTLIMIHGFMLDAYWFNAQMFSLRWFYRQGYDVLLYTLPFHGYRGEARDWFSGYRLFSGGLLSFNEALVQAVRDLRVFMDHLQARGVRHIGVTGLSLGGYTAALLAAVDARLAFCVPNAPVVSPADLMREWQPLGSVLQWLLARAECGICELRHALAVHNPLTYAPKIAGERVLIVGGAGDRFSPPRHLRLLQEHFAGSRLHWFPGNHLLHLQQRQYLQVMKAFMDGRCVDKAGG